MKFSNILMLVLPILFLSCSRNTILSYGAKGDGKTNNTLFIQKAIDEKSYAGGGIVTIPKGRFVIGSIELKSGVSLHLAKGAELLGSTFRKDYNTYQRPSLIYAKGQRNIGITGEGIIDGRGRALIRDIFRSLEDGSLRSPNDYWRETRPGESARTNLIYFEECTDVMIKDVTCKDATTWVTHYERCRNITIDHHTIESTAYWNNDGIDIVDCKNVRISNSHINTADDAICLKSGHKNDYCDSIFIDNCTLRSSANALKLGTGSLGGFRNIKVNNLKVYDTYRSAIALEAVDGGFLENIDIRNVTATHTGNAIFIRLGHRNNDEKYSKVKNIYIGNVKVEVPAEKPDAGYETEGPLLMYPPGFTSAKDRVVSVSPWNYKMNYPSVNLYRHNVFPSSISGLPNHPVENVVLENIEIIYKTKSDTTKNYFPLSMFDSVTEAVKDYPEFSMFGEVPAWGFYVRHVSGLTMKNVQLTMAGIDYRSAFLFNDVKDLSLHKVNATGEFSQPTHFYNKVLKVNKSE